jgi:hypothetical protein
MGLACLSRQPFFVVKRNVSAADVSHNASSSVMVIKHCDADDINRQLMSYY